MTTLSKNEAELAAWNEWKEICSILGCSAENRSILAQRVTDAFKAKLNRVIGEELNGEFNLNTQNIDESDFSIPPVSNTALDSDEKEECEEKETAQDQISSGLPLFQKKWAHEFDCGILEKSSLAKAKKNYKDYTWYSIEHSDDPPLKIIRGQLTGPLGIINEIAERYLRCNHPLLWEKAAGEAKQEKKMQQEASRRGIDWEQYKKVYYQRSKLFVSIDEPVNNSGDDDELLRGDTIAAASSAPIYAEDKKILRNMFSCEQAAVLLADSVNFSLADPELLSFLQCGHSKTYLIFSKEIPAVIRKCKPEIRALLRQTEARTYLIYMLFRQIKAEKGSEAFLKKVKEQLLKQNRKGVDNGIAF